MFKRILKYCVLLMMGMILTACCMSVADYPYPANHQECYHYANDTVDCYRYYY